jgi:hypothetical protein
MIRTCVCLKDKTLLQTYQDFVALPLHCRRLHVVMDVHGMKDGAKVDRFFQVLSQLSFV